MTLALVLGLLLLSGLTLFGALIVSRRARRALESRVALVAVDVASDDDPKPFEAVVRAPSRWAERVRDAFSLGISRRWGMQSSGAKLLLIAAAAATLIWLAFHVGLHFSDWLALLLGGLGFIYIPRKLVQMEQARTELQFMDFFPNAIDMVVRMLRVGMPVTAAIRAVGQEAPSPVNAVFTSLADQVEIGISFEDALNNAGERIGLTDFRFFAVAISLQRTSGGNLVTTLETLSDIIRRRRATRLKAKSATAEVRMSTYVLASIPFLVIGGMMILSPGYLAPLIDDPRGNMIVLTAVSMLLLGFLTMRQMMRSAMRL